MAIITIIESIILNHPLAELEKDQKTDEINEKKLHISLIFSNFVVENNR